MMKGNRGNYPFLRIPTVDKLLTDNAKLVASLQSSNMTEEEEETLKDASINLDVELEDIQEVIDETLDYLLEKGCDVYKYLK